MIRETWPVSDGKLEESARETAEDKILSIVMTYTAAGRPKSISHVNPAVHEVFPVKNELSIKRRPFDQRSVHGDSTETAKGYIE